MKDKMRRWLKRVSDGQSLVEMALALPVLLLMFLAMIEMGMLLRAHLIVQGGCREGARFAARGQFTNEDIAARMSSFIDAGPDSGLAPNFGAPDGNIQFIITRFNVPAALSEHATYQPSYITGTLNLPSQITPATYAAQLKAENDQFNNDLIAAQKDAMRTSQQVAVVEIYYYHYEVLHAPLVEWIFPDPMVVYSRAVMRVGQGRVY